jgi:hypothetical protein
VLLAAGSAQAEERPPEAPRPLRVKPVAVVLAVVPGALVGGLGHRVAGDKRTADRLLSVEGAGLLAIAAGALPVAASGASRYTWPSIPLLVGGVGVFLGGWFSDIYGTAGGARRGAAPELRMPPARITASYAYVRDPQFDYASFTVLGADVWWRSLRATPSAWLALDDDNQRLRGAVAKRLLGARADADACDGTWMEIESALTHHRHGTERFATTTAELSLVGRLDLGRIGASLDGAFAEVGVGLGLDRIGYRDADDDWTTQLLGRTAWGVYLGRPGRARGELVLYYDHRRDDYAGGLALGGGFLGYFGAGARYELRSGWGVTAAGELGSANIVRVGLVRRIGGDR